ncbi:MAG: molecular chaperone TorD family protein [Anaerolineales bacterium]|nr:molecular chaperone TorD family protein [Anaerolineales bacterium]
MYTETEMRSSTNALPRRWKYPRAARSSRHQSAGTVDGRRPASAAQLKKFHDYAASLPPGRLEEVYTGTFDLDAALPSYVGYHLFGETYKRSVFLVELETALHRRRLRLPDNELPDHLAVILHFLATRGRNAGAGNPA